MLDPCSKLGWPQWSQAEVIEQVVSEFQGVQLASTYQYQQGLDWDFYLAEAAAQGKGALRVTIGYYDGA